jgi:hypothetical protein
MTPSHTARQYDIATQKRVKGLVMGQVGGMVKDMAISYTKSCQLQHSLQRLCILMIFSIEHTGSRLFTIYSIIHRSLKMKRHSLFFKE